jgi:ATP-binding cassette subfamily B protein
LCRFYDPDEGRILLDGADLRNFDPSTLRREMSILFQDPVRYQASLRENIGFGEVGELADEARIHAAAHKAGVSPLIARLPDGMDMQLGRWFGGTELSGGEWQRVALARAFFRNGSLVILDEPTSAMDSWAELDWLQRFHQLTAGKTGLMITHRFTTAMHADIIHVLDLGRIIESGTHAELLKFDGSYAHSWRAQTQEIENGHVRKMVISHA